MSTFCSLAARYITRKSSSLPEKVSTCLTPSRAHILSNKCWTYQRLLNSRGYMAVGYNTVYQLKPCTSKLANWNPGILSGNNDSFGVPIRLKSRGHNNPHVKAAKKKQKAEVEDDTDSDDEDEDEENESEGEVWDKHFDEDDDFPQRYKEMKKRVNSLRCDAIVSAGLATSRRKIEDAFLSSQLYLNGEKVLKPGKKAAEGDYIDLLEKDDGETKVKRVRIVKVEKVDGQDKSEAYLRCWRGYVATDQYS